MQNKFYMCVISGSYSFEECIDMSFILQMNALGLKLWLIADVDTNMEIN